MSFSIIAKHLMSRVFANGPGDPGSIPGRVIPKTQKLLLDAALHNTRHYKVWIKGKVEQSRKWSSAFPYTSGLELLKREPLGLPRLRSPTLFTYRSEFTLIIPSGISVFRRHLLGYYGILSLKGIS